jgi:hypothetical protein
LEESTEMPVSRKWLAYSGVQHLAERENQVCVLPGGFLRALRGDGEVVGEIGAASGSAAN